MNGRRPVGTPPTPGWEQAHVDIGALAQRVIGLEGAIGAITGQISDLSKKLDNRPTNWYGFVGVTVALLGLGGGFFLQATAPMNSNIAKNADHIDKMIGAIGKISDDVVWRVDFRDYEKETATQTQRSVDRQRADEDAANGAFRKLTETVGRIDERTKVEHENELGIADRARARVDSIDSQLVKRPEIEAENKAIGDRIEAGNKALGDRIDALSARENATQAQLENLFPAQEIIKELWSSLRELRFHDPAK